jgi:filamentous hemagglutinin family protein
MKPIQLIESESTLHFQELMRIAAVVGRITGSARQPISVIDGLLAATALEQNLTFVTQNGRYVAATSVPRF